MHISSSLLLYPKAFKVSSSHLNSWIDFAISFLIIWWSSSSNPQLNRMALGQQLYSLSGSFIIYSLMSWFSSCLFGWSANIIFLAGISLMFICSFLEEFWWLTFYSFSLSLNSWIYLLAISICLSQKLQKGGCTFLVF